MFLLIYTDCLIGIKRNCYALLWGSTHGHCCQRVSGSQRQIVGDILQIRSLPVLHPVSGCRRESTGAATREHVAIRCINVNFNPVGSSACPGESCLSKSLWIWSKWIRLGAYRASR